MMPERTYKLYDYFRALFTQDPAKIALRTSRRLFAEYDVEIC